MNDEFFFYRSGGNRPEESENIMEERQKKIEIRQERMSFDRKIDTREGIISGKQD